MRSVSEFLSDATAVAVPVHSGVGAPLKYAEALASGAPVIATVDGAPLRSSLPVCVSDDPNRWVAALAGRWIDPPTTSGPGGVLEHRCWKSFRGPR